MSDHPVDFNRVARWAEQRIDFWEELLRVGFEQALLAELERRGMKLSDLGQAPEYWGTSLYTMAQALQALRCTVHMELVPFPERNSDESH